MLYAGGGVMQAVVHIDTDPTEIGKNVAAHIPIVMLRPGGAAREMIG